MGTIPSYLPFKFSELPGLNPIRITYFVLIFNLLHAILSSKAIRLNIYKVVKQNKLIFLLTMLYVFWGFASALASETKIQSVSYFIRSLNWIPIAITATVCIKNYSDVKKVFLFLSLGCITSSVIAVLERLYGSNLFINIFPLDKEQVESLSWIAEDKSRGGKYRVAGIFSHPLALGEYLSMCLPVVGSMAFATNKKIFRVALFSSIPLVFFAIYLTQTRSSIISAAISLLFYLLLIAAKLAKNKTSFSTAIAGWFGISAVSFLIIGSIGVAISIAQGNSTEEVGSSAARLIMVERTIESINKSPYFGYGPGNAAITIGYIGLARNLTIDSYYLSILLESGIPALIFFILLFIFISVKTLYAGLNSPHPKSLTIFAIFIAILSSLTIKSILSLTNNFELLFLLCTISLLLAENRLASDEQNEIK
jgi:O-antigen ligase